MSKVGFKLVNGLKKEVRKLQKAAEAQQDRRREYDARYYAEHAEERRRYAAKKRAEKAEAQRAWLEAAVEKGRALAASGQATRAQLEALPDLEKRLRMSDAQRARRLREVVG